VPQELSRSYARAKRAAGIGFLAASAGFGVASAFSFARAVHGYAAAYVHPAVFAAAALLALSGALLLLPRGTRRAGRVCLLAAPLLVCSYLGSIQILHRAGKIGWEHKERVTMEPTGDRLQIRFSASALELDVDRVWKEGLSLAETPRGQPLRAGIRFVDRTGWVQTLHPERPPVDAGLTVGLTSELLEAQREDLVERLQAMPGVAEVVFIAATSERDPRPTLR